MLMGGEPVLILYVSCHGTSMVTLGRHSVKLQRQDATAVMTLPQAPWPFNGK